MEYYCKGCNIKSVQLVTEKLNVTPGTRSSRQDMTGDRYCLIFHEGLNEQCPCPDCLLIASCSSSCETRDDLRREAIGIARGKNDTM